MANVFAEHLPHFALNGMGGLELSGRLKPFGSAAVDAPPADGPREAEARGRREAMAEAEIRIAKIRADDREEYEARLAEKEAAFAEATADLLAGRLTGALAAIEENIAGHVATALLRFMDTAVRTRAVSELTETVNALLVGGAGVRIRVTGPEAVVARLRQQLAARGDSVEYAVADTSDLTVAIDDTIVQTRIGAWLARIADTGAGVAHG